MNVVDTDELFSLKGESLQDFLKYIFKIVYFCMYQCIKCLFDHRSRQATIII